MAISFKGRKEKDRESTRRLRIKLESKITLFLFGNNNSIFLVKWSGASPAVEHTPPDWLA